MQTRTIAEAARKVKLIWEYTQSLPEEGLPLIPMVIFEPMFLTNL